MPLGFLFWVYVVGYPLMVLWTVVRGRDAVRMVAVAAALFGVPFWAWSLWRVFGPSGSGDVSGILVLLIAPWFLLVQGILTFVVFFQENRSGPAGDGS